MSKRKLTNGQSEMPPKKQYKNASQYPTHESEDIWCNLNNMPDKKLKKQEIQCFKKFISGTDIKNYLNNDPLLDWLDHYYKMNIVHKDIITRKKNNIFSEKHVEETNNCSFLCEHGNDFENRIINYLTENYSQDLIIINTEGRQGYTETNFQKTKKAMMDGIPMIIQSVLFNNNNTTGGISDILIRSDFVNKLIKRQVLTQEEETFKAVNLSGNYHYIVIDIKWTTMILCANGYNIRNEGRFPSYKGQLAIYNCAMGNIQGFVPRQAYIMAKAWKIDRKGFEQEGYNCFDLLGVIDYNGFDYQFIQKTIDAIKWVREVRHDGINWNPHKPHRNELYPNVSNKFDMPWTKIKNELAVELNEITQIWYVNVPHRIKAHSQGIMNWRDKNCNSQTLGITGLVKPNIIDAILDINRDNTQLVNPKKITNNNFKWQTHSPVDFYVDFETITGCFRANEIDILNSKTHDDIIFMIGVGYEYNNIWYYKDFTVEHLTHEEEYKIFHQFTQFVNDKIKEFDPNNIYVPRLFHWSHAEVTNFAQVNSRHNYKFLKWEQNIQWLDMYNVFINEPIVVHGALNFKLKSIGKSLHKLKLIKSCWDDNGPSDGLDAMYSAIKHYTEQDTELMNNIIKYNEMDCKILWEIVLYLRYNHV